MGGQQHEPFLDGDSSEGEFPEGFKTGHESRVTGDGALDEPAHELPDGFPTIHEA